MSPAGPEPAPWPPSREALVADLGCAALTLALLRGHRVFTHDTWWHLVLGQQMLEGRSLPVTDTLSHTAYGAQVHPHAWLWELAAAVIDKLGGLQAVELACGLGVALTLRLVFSCGVRAGAGPLAAAAAVVGFGLSTENLFIARPQLVSYYAMAWLMWLYLRSRQGQPAPAVPVLLGFVLWSNLHGGFLIGIAFLLGVGLLEAVEVRWLPDSGDRRSPARWGALGLGAAVVACVHPEGVGQYVNAWANTPWASPVIATINEWGPPMWSALVVLVPMLLLGLIAAFLPAAKPRSWEVLLFLGSGALALTTMRNVPFFGIVGAPVMAAWLSRAWRHWRASAAATSDRAGTAQARLLVLGFVVAVVAGLVPRDPLDHESLRRRYPVEASTWIARESPPGEMFNTYEWGGFLAYRLRPDTRVYIDSRMVPFLPDVAREYTRVIHALPGWERVLDARAVGFLVIPERMPRFKPLRVGLRESGRWSVAYRDARTAIWVRDEGS